MSKEKRNVIGVFSKLEAVGNVAFAVQFSPEEFDSVIDSYCNENGCKECKYFNSKNKNCCRPPLKIYFEKSV